MSLFIGVISSGMFEAFLRVKLDSNKEKYMRSLEVNTSLDDEDARKKLKQNRRTSVAAPRRHTMSTPFVELLQGALRPHPSLQELIDTAMSDEVLDGKRGHHSTMEEAAEHLIEQRVLPGLVAPLRRGVGELQLRELAPALADPRLRLDLQHHQLGVAEDQAALL